MGWGSVGNEMGGGGVSGVMGRIMGSDHVDVGLLWGMWGRWGCGVGESRTHRYGVLIDVRL